MERNRKKRVGDGQHDMNPLIETVTAIQIHIQDGTMRIIGHRLVCYFIQSEAGITKWFENKGLNNLDQMIETT